MCQVGTVGKIFDYEPDGPEFNPWPGRGLNFWWPSYATPSVDRDITPLILSPDMKFRRLRKTQTIVKEGRARLVLSGLNSSSQRHKQILSGFQNFQNSAATM